MNFIEELADEFGSLLLNPKENDFKVIVGDLRLFCAKDDLISKCQYFKAYFDFHDPGKETSVEIEIPENANFDEFSVERIINGDLAEIGEDPIGLLFASAFLGCEEAESAACAELESTLTLENSFGTFVVGLETGCNRLRARAEEFILETYVSLTFEPKNLIEILKADFCHFRKRFLNKIRENLKSFYLILGWTLFAFENRVRYLDILLEEVPVEIMDPNLSIPDEFADVESIRRFLNRQTSYRELSLKEKVAFSRLKMKMPSTNMRWPKTPLLWSIGDGVIKYVKPKAGCWAKLTKTPSKLNVKSSGCQMVAHENSLYFIGGHDNDSMWTYDVTFDEWKKLAATQDERIRAAVVSVKGDIFIFGGYKSAGKSSLSTVLETAAVFNVDTLTWRMLTPMDEPRSGARAVHFEGNIYILGGVSDRRMVATKILIYDIEKDEYENGPDLPFMTEDFAVCLVDEKIVTLGGVNPLTFVPINNVASLNLRTLHWNLTTMAELNEPTSGNFAYFDGYTVKYIGVKDKEILKPRPFLESYDPLMGKWVPETNSSLSRGGRKNSFVFTCTAISTPVRLMDNYEDLSRSNVRIMQNSNKTNLFSW